MYKNGIQNGGFSIGLQLLYLQWKTLYSVATPQMGRESAITQNDGPFYDF